MTDETSGSSLKAPHDVVEGAAEHVSTTSQRPWLTWALAASAVVVFVGALVLLIRMPPALASVPAVGGVLADTDKVWMLAIWVTTAISAVVVIVADRHRPRASRSVAVLVYGASLLGISIVLLAVLWMDPPFLTSVRGLGVAPMLLGGVAALALLRLVSRPRPWNRSLLVVSIVVTIVLGTLPLLRLPWSFEDGYNNYFTFDELLAPANGRLAGFDFISQYQTLLGLPLALLAAIFPAAFRASPEWFATAWLVMLQIATLVIAIVVLLRVAPRRIQWLVPLLFLPVAFLRGSEGLYYYAVFPIRLILPMCLLLALVLSVRMRSEGRRWWTTSLVGVLAGATAFNNLDYGVPAAIAAGVTIVLASGTLKGALLSLGRFAIGLPIVPALYLILGSLVEGSFHPSFATFFVRSFGLDNIYNADLPIFGIYVGFVVLGVLAVIVGALGTRRLGAGRGGSLHQAMLFSGAFLLLSLVYFSGRSLTPTLVGGYAVVAGLVLVLLVIAGIDQLPRLQRRGDFGSAAGVQVALMTVVGLAVSVASWTFFPSPDESLGHLAMPPPADGEVEDYLRPDPTAALDAVPDDGESVGLLGYSATAWSLRLGIDNGLVFASPLNLTIPGAADLQCEHLEGRPEGAWVVTRESLDALRQSPQCDAVLDFDSARRLVVDRIPLRFSPDQLRVVEWMLVSRR